MNKIIYDMDSNFEARILRDVKRDAKIIFDNQAIKDSRIATIEASKKIGYPITQNQLLKISFEIVFKS